MSSYEASVCKVFLSRVTKDLGEAYKFSPDEIKEEINSLKEKTKEILEKIQLQSLKKES